MRRLMWIAAAAALLAGCAKKESVEYKPEEDKKVEQAKPKAAPPYKPKPGETVVMLSFKTESDRVLGNGDVYIRLFPQDAPKTCAHIVDLVKKNYYEGILVHRVELGEEFKLTQFGNAATKDGNPNPGQEVGSGSTVPLEVKRLHTVGAVGMARADVNSGDAQMYICFVNIPQLDRGPKEGYTVFGEVAQGLDVAEGLGIGSKIVKCQVVQEAGK